MHLPRMCAPHRGKGHVAPAGWAGAPAMRPAARRASALRPPPAQLVKPAGVAADSDYGFGTKRRGGGAHMCVESREWM
jgi:hypothetical protein